MQSNFFLFVFTNSMLLMRDFSILMS
jgi:hypothetical protein